MRNLLITGTIVFALLLAACNSDEDSEYAVKSDVGNITKDEFYEELVALDNGNLLQQLILEMVLKDKYSVDEKEVDEQIDELKEEYGESFEMIMMQQGYQDEDDFREALHTSLLYEQAIFEGVEIDEEEIESTYERMKEKIEARHILVANEETAQEVKDELDDGADFEDLVAEYSIEPGAAETGGNLGFFTALDMDKPFEDAAYDMEVDEISGPVEGANGFHIIHVLDRRDNEDLPEFDDVSGEIEDRLKRSKVSDEEANEKIDQLLIDANLDIKVPGMQDLFQLEE